MLSQKNLRTIVAAGVTTAVVLAPSPARAGKLGAALNEIDNATQIVRDITIDPDKRIPSALIRDSKGIVVLSNVSQGGFIFGGRGGDGLMMIRQVDGEWGNPAFLKVGGGNIGLQAGYKKGDIVLLLMNRSAVDKFLNGDIDFGGNVAGVAGPIGATAVNPNQDDNEILAYSFTDGGLYGGVTLEGGTFSFEDRVNEAFYNIDGITPRAVLFDSRLDPARGGRELQLLYQTIRSAE